MFPSLVARNKTESVGILAVEGITDEFRQGRLHSRQLMENVPNLGEAGGGYPRDVDSCWSHYSIIRKGEQNYSFDCIIFLVLLNLIFVFSDGSRKPTGNASENH